MAAKLEARRVARKALYDALYRGPSERLRNRVDASLTDEFIALEKDLLVAEEAVDAEKALNPKSSTEI
jgi:hypothetical protein